MFKQGYICLVGKPNVGKSTLMNKIMNYKVSITSHKPQTTRMQIKGLYKDEDTRIVFIDTPGFHQTHNKLDELMNDEVKLGLKIADVVFFLFDPTRPFTEEDERILKLIFNLKIENVFMVITKKDMNYNNSNKLEYVKDNYKFSNIFEISSKENIGITELLNNCKPYLHETSIEPVDPIDNDNLIISELIREQIIFNTKKEVPYSTYVKIEHKEMINNLFEIQAVIVVEKESQKPILIGKGGKMIKKIGTLARQELLKIYDCKINLKLFVKVSEN